MSNPIPESMKTGTIGELLVQLRLLQYEVQAAPPIKDSGNDLIAVREEVFKAIQVKTSTVGNFNVNNLPERYHILALVKLEVEDQNIKLDSSKIFLLEKDEVKKTSYKILELGDKELNLTRVSVLFK